MPEPVEVAIEYALMAQAVGFAEENSLTISLPNIAFSPPISTPTTQWLRATYLPVPSLAMGISFDAFIKHYGMMQLDVFQGSGGGSMAPARLAAEAVAYFQRGGTLTKDGFEILFVMSPYRSRAVTDEQWLMVPVSIPYWCFARPT